MHIKPDLYQQARILQLKPGEASRTYPTNKVKLLMNIETLSAQDLDQQDCCWVYRSPIHLCQLGKFGFDQEGLISRAKHNVTTLWENLFNLRLISEGLPASFSICYDISFHYVSSRDGGRMYATCSHYRRKWSTASWMHKLFNTRLCYDFRTSVSKLAGVSSAPPNIHMMY